MRIASFMMVLVLAMPASPALGDNNKSKCNDINDKELRKACQQNDYDNVDCSKFDSDSMRRECRERKSNGNGNRADVDCSKIDDEDLRRKCREKKYD
jgi:hypothetical protein